MSNFVHLHLHSQYSLLDGTIQFGPLVRRVKELGMPAVAVTDHGAMMGAVEFYEEANKAGVKPILGMEAYVATGACTEKQLAPNGEYAYHLVLLAENDTGYKNLLALSSLGYTKGFYYKPRIDKELLREYSEGLIATSACLQGEIPAVLAAEGEAKALQVLEEYRSIFTDGRFFLEIQSNGMQAQDRMNQRIIELARRTDTPLVATNDCHYLNPEDARFQEILLCLQTGKTISDPTRMRFETDQFYVKTAEEFERAFGSIAPDALSNTLLIAERCNTKIELGVPCIPELKLSIGETSEQRLWENSIKGLEERLEERRVIEGDLPPALEEEYRNRLSYELSVIEKTGFSGYFLIVSDFIKWAKAQGIPVGPGRGSAAGSLVAFCLQITEVDPIPYKLLFERFLNPERISLPDIDCDFCNIRRDEVIKYVQEKYGKENVAQLITFGTWKPRAAVRDVGRVLEMPYAEVDRIAKLIPADLKMTLENAPKAEPQLQEMIDSNPKVAELFRYSMQIEGRSRHAGTHASAVVIADRPITEFSPLYRQTTNEITTQYEMRTAEKVGLVKFDLLGLKTLTVINSATELVKEHKGVEIDLKALPLTDKKTYETLSLGDTAGVFQSESSGFTSLLARLKPDRFNHLIDMVALYRPGPLQSGMVDDFVERRHGRKKVNYSLPQLQEILSDTYGVIVYQEQVMEIGKALAGFTLGQADVLRKAMGKKDDALMEKQKELFLEGARANKIPEKKAEEIFELIRQFGGYGFNKSHSAAYALLAYQTAYLKTHYPIEFYSALMTSESGDTDKIIRYIAHCRGRGIPILPPDVNESRYAFLPSGGSIRFGLSAIKGLGASAVDSILEARKQQEQGFESVRDFLSHIDLSKVNKRAMESLIKSGAFDSLNQDRGKLFNDLQSLLEEAQAEARRKEIGQFTLFGSMTQEKPSEGKSAGKAAEAQKETWDLRMRLTNEKDALGFYITGHPLDSCAAEISMYANTTTAGLANLRSDSEVKIGGIISQLRERTTKKGERMVNLSIEDLDGTAEVTVFPKVYQECRDILTSSDPVFVVGRLKSTEKGTEIHADELFLISNVKERLARSVHFRLDMSNPSSSDLEGLAKTIRRFGGDKKAFLHIPRKGEYEAVIELPNSMNVNPSLDLARELKNRFGYNVLDLK